MIFGFVLLCVCVSVHECVRVFRMFLSELRINVFTGARNADFIKELGERECWGELVYHTVP